MMRVPKVLRMRCSIVGTLGAKAEASVPIEWQLRRGLGRDLLLLLEGYRSFDRTFERKISGHGHGFIFIMKSVSENTNGLQSSETSSM
jgi:hypothetical protein